MMDRPNKWLLEAAEKYPELAPGLSEVADYIDRLRYACGIAKSHLDQIIGTARTGIEASEREWAPPAEHEGETDGDV